MSLPSPRASVQRSSTVPAFLALSCVGAFATAPAYAADADKPAAPVTDAQQRDEILVNGQRERDSGPKQVAPLVNTPRSVIVLPKDVIEQTGSNSLADALRTVPGITFGAAEGGNPIGDRPFIRGFDSQGSIYVDGVRDLASQTREVFAVDSVQIVRGSDSTLGGRGSAGGTINILSRLPQLENFGSLSGSYGEADYKRITGDVNLKISDTAAFRIEGMWHDQDVAGRDAIWAKRWGIAPSFAVGLGTPTRLTASLYHMESSELPDSGIPYLYTIANHPGTGNISTLPALGTVTTAGGQTGYVSRKNFYGLANRDFRDANTNQATIRVEHDFGGITLRNTARYTHSDQSYIFTLPDDSQGNVYGTTATNTGANVTNGGYVWTRGNTRYGYSESIVDQTDLYGKFDTGGIEHSFSLGTEISWEKTRRGAFVSANGSTISPRCNTATIARSYCVSLFNPNPNAPWVNYTSDTSTTPTPIVKGATSAETQNDANTKAVYAFDSITLMPALILNLGARYDRFESTITLPGATQTKVKRVDNLFNWQAGLVFKPTPETSLYASYATAATPPNSLLGEGREDNAITVATLSLLKPQKTKSYEVGAKASLFGEKLQLGAAAFQTEISNARVLDDSNTASFIGETRIRGVEFNVSGTILPGWTVFGGFTHLDPKIIDGGSTILTAPAITRTANGVTTVIQPARTIGVVSVNTGKQVPQTAKNSFTATTNVAVTKRLQIGGTALYMDEQIGGYADNRTATQTAAGVVSVNPATKVLTRSTPDYWRFDARASYKLTDNVDLSVNAQNLTNKTYFSQTYASHYATLAAGRTIFGTVNLRF
ncbi:catecholate siderophore receptor [Sphingomonas sp. PP-F2F-G114-C0414]|uniref:TonB-dependent receptor n=1 Tax=Sphingomonas sp. PP-F2F-G114-C0414 TaxID=2135662 RepID=UPI000EF923A7|nr:TonB-dependent receptor [Sphingomonas sp. PP-F2F-G114-C0414]RMB36628.1 catecholate siderophore receptor [Sphingomonas sp. PP-F2F-G114-C0414]